MKLFNKNNKGMLGVDLAIAIVVLSIFMSIISILIYNISLSINGSKRNTAASTYVVDVLEKVKSVQYSELDMNNMETIITSIDSLKSIQTIDNGKTLNSNNEYEYKGKISGYTVHVTMKKYCDLPENAGRNLDDKVKIVTVNVEYNLGRNVQNVQISTLVTI